MGFKKGLAVVTVAAITTIFSVSASYLHYKAIKHFVGGRTALLHVDDGSFGTGFIVKAKSGKRVMITAGHVCGESKAATSSKQRLTVIKVNNESDLCALSIPDGFTGGSLTVTAEPFLDFIASVGFPGKNPLTLSPGLITGEKSIKQAVGTILFGKLTNGVCRDGMEVVPVDPFGIAAACVTLRTLITTTVVVDFGSSGSPVVDILGNVVGVVSFKETTTGRALLTPASQLLDFISDL